MTQTLAAYRDWIRSYHLTVLRELAALADESDRAEWTGCEAAAMLEAHGLLTSRDDLYYITDAGLALVDEEVQ